MEITVRLIKPLKNKIVTYRAELLERRDGAALIMARWEHDLVDLGYISFAPGDVLFEHFYSDRWYNVYAVYDAAGLLKGWYCNVTRPAVFAGGSIESEDLELDLFVAPDRRTLLVLDEDEYAARGLATTEPEAHHAALAALEELRDRALQGEEPFVMRSDVQKRIAALQQGAP